MSEPERDKERDKITVRGLRRRSVFTLEPGWTPEDEQKYRDGADNPDDGEES